MIRTLWVWLIAFVFLVRYGIPILVRAARGSQRLPETCRQNPKRWSLRILRAAGVDVVLEGVEHLEATRPCVLVANHSSWFDVFALVGHLPVEYRFVAKKELESIPIFGRSWQACGHISIDRSDRSKAIQSLERVKEVMREARPAVIMFPEGTRSQTGELLPFKKGPFVLALQTGVPVVPAAIVGARDIMHKGDWRIRKGQVRVRIGAPIHVEGLEEKHREALGDAAYRAIAGLGQGAALDTAWWSSGETETN